MAQVWSEGRQEHSTPEVRTHALYIYTFHVIVFIELMYLGAKDH